MRTGLDAHFQPCRVRPICLMLAPSPSRSSRPGAVRRSRPPQADVICVEDPAPAPQGRRSDEKTERGGRGFSFA